MAFDELEVVADCNESASGQAVIVGSREGEGFTIVTLQTPRNQHDRLTPLVGRPIREITKLGQPDSNFVPNGKTVMIEVFEETQ